MTITIGIILAIFLSLILISKKGKSLPDKILLAWLITIATTLILYKLQTEEARYNYPFFLGWGFPFPLLQWPFLYVYVVALTSKEPLRVRLLLHFLPFVCSVLLFSRYFFLPNQLKIDIYNRQGEGYETEMTINLMAIILSAIVYTILSGYELLRYKQRIKDEFSSTEKITLNWLRYLIIGMTCILFVVLLGGNDEYIFSSITFLVLYIGYFGIKQVGIFNENFQMEQRVVSINDSQLTSENVDSSNTNETITIPEIVPTPEKVKYEKTKISDDEMIAIHQQLKELMYREKLYKNAELTLSEVAQKIPVHPNTLSQVINTAEGKNFYDYINLQRIEEFQRIIFLPQNKEYTLLSLAFECGFNSKTSFNRNFKKVTHLSPSEYIKQKNIQLKD
ncbi:MAG: AraC family transcriptional regulator [Bacteroidetes bacterium]|nr:MAG: AraC family transcriptional regulator [Bacteroidota bacterium]